MDISNVKLDWAPILEAQIKHLESLYPDIPVRKSYSGVIESLNSNKLKSRVILSGINVSAYAFITPSGDLSDRIYGSVGFTNPAFATEERINNLLSWLEDTARIQKKYIMLNEIFNAEDLAEKVMRSRGFVKFTRLRLSRKLSDLPSFETVLKGDYKELPIKKLRIEEYSDAEFDAFSGTADQILFNTDNRKERIDFSRNIFTGKLGNVIESATKILVRENKIAAATVCTHYRSLDGSRTALLVDIFVKKIYQGQGLASNLLMFSLKALAKAGYEECVLWVSGENPAKSLYDRFGFTDTGTSEVFYYKKP